jgi:hypothetical protein
MFNKLIKLYEKGVEVGEVEKSNSLLKEILFVLLLLIFKMI